MRLLWGSVVTISHFYGAVIGAWPLCIENRNGLVDRMRLINVARCKLQTVYWLTRKLFVICFRLGFFLKKFINFLPTKVIAQSLLLFVGSVTFLEVKVSAYGFFSGWLAIILQTLCGFSFGILLFVVLRKKVSIIITLVILELLVSALSGKQKRQLLAYEFTKK